MHRPFSLQATFLKAGALFAFAFLALVLFWPTKLGAQTPATTPPPKGDSMVLTIEGKVEVLRIGANNWVAGHTNMVLRSGDRIRTGPRSRATLRMSNLTMLRVSELTTMEIRASLQTGQAPVLDLKSGTAYFFSRERPTELEFRTPLSSGAVRGTEFNLAVAEDGSTLVTLLDGAVDLSNQSGQMVALKNGDQGVVEAGKAPARTATINAINIIQWSLYYPGILDVDELNLGDAEKRLLGDSLAAYRKGDLLKALAAYPEDRQPASDAEKIYRAALLLAVGQVEQVEAQLKSLSATSPLADALRQVIAAVKFQVLPSTLPPAKASERRAGNPQPSTKSATEWMAESYYQQSRSKLEEARKAARAAVAKSPNFGFAHVRVAEMEFSFGRTPEARASLEKGLELSPRNAQGLSLKGFLLAAQNHISEAKILFEQAIAADGALGNAWLGLGLVKIRQGQGEAGRADIQTAATLEPQRALYRSYLGKAFSYTKDQARAERELNRSKMLDPNDPTVFLYSALLNEQNNRVNEGVRDLEKSQELNDNRSVFRSRLLLDQDRAVRGANLARIYHDAGMFDVSVREASRAVNSDFANYSAHLFLADSYDALRDPRQINLRYETPWLSEFLLANLLGPVDGNLLSQHVSQQEYTRLFERDRVGISSSTEYLSRGAWLQKASQFGTFGKLGYALDVEYRSDNGQRKNEDLEQLTLYAKFKAQLTPQDSLLFQAIYSDTSAGDLLQYYNQANAQTTQRIAEKQEPLVFAGYHHEWAPGIHTLFLAGRLNDTFDLTDQTNHTFTLNHPAGGPVTSAPNRTFAQIYHSELEGATVEGQQIWEMPSHTLIAGARYQIADTDNSSTLTRNPYNAAFPIYNNGNVPPPFNPAAAQQNSVGIERLSVYGYYLWQLLDPLQLTLGVSYDRLYYPRNIDIPPVSNDQLHKDKLSPKLGLIWRPAKNTVVRGIYTRSLGGVFFDNSVRLEPTQVAGFQQAFRSVIPESVAGLVAGTEFKTYGLGLEQKFKTGTYLTLDAEILESDADRTVGVFDFTTGTLNAVASGTQERLSFREKSLTANLNQLISDEWSVGARYRISDAELNDAFPNIPVALPPNRSIESTLHQASFYGLYNIRCGFFAQAEAAWYQQSNRGYAPNTPGDDFWQFNVYAGYRFPRRKAEIRVGLLNIADTGYQLQPLSFYYELPRDRTFAVSLKFNF